MIKQISNHRKLKQINYRPLESEASGSNFIPIQ